MEDLRTPLGKVIEKMMDDCKEAKAGSEESKVIAGNIEKLYSLYLEDVKTDEYLYRDQQEIELNKIKYDKESTSKKWYERVSPDMVVSCGTVFMLTIAAFQLEKSGHILPTRMLQLINRIKV
ncbi:MAG: hypothetical protein J6Y02_20295 [Pseudobutyrivibrio sp.]|nr:hypothetical protein [Pseudobutyrivibrio sp.]